VPSDTSHGIATLYPVVNHIDGLKDKNVACFGILSIKICVLSLKNDNSGHIWAIILTPATSPSPFEASSTTPVKKMARPTNPSRREPFTY
jgi:hypothetical protein